MAADDITTARWPTQKLGLPALLLETGLEVRKMHSSGLFVLVLVVPAACEHTGSAAAVSRTINGSIKMLVSLYLSVNRECGCLMSCVARRS